MMMMTCLILWMPELAARAGSPGGPCWRACAATLAVNAPATVRADAAMTTRRNLIKSLHSSPGPQDTSLPDNAASAANSLANRRDADRHWLGAEAMTGVQRLDLMTPPSIW